MSLKDFFNEGLEGEEIKALKRALIGTSSESIAALIDFLKGLEEDALHDLSIKSRVPIGNGNVGLVFHSVEPGKVVKLTNVSGDYDIADKVKGMKHLLQVHDKKEVPVGDGKFFALTSDKMNHLDNEVFDLINSLKELWEKEKEEKSREIDLSRSKARFEKLINYHKENEEIMSPKAREALQQLLSMISSLHDKGIAFNDFKPSQFMKNNNDELVLVDLGALRSCSEEEVGNYKLKDFF